MPRDKLTVKILSFLSFAVLLIPFFLNLGTNAETLVITAGIMTVMTFVVFFGIRRRRSTSIRKRDVFLLHVAVSVLYVILLHMSGLHFGYYRNPYAVSVDLFLKTVIPITVIIVATEIIRAVFMAQRSKFASLMAFFMAVMAEALTVSSLSGVTTFNKFMDLVGMTLFPALVANVYFHHVSRNYGVWPNIPLRLITTLYVYLLPTTSAISDALAVCGKIFLPLILLAMVSSLYETKKKKALRKGHKLGWAFSALTVVIVVAVTMLISCQFHYGALVIATESMTGEINKGDMIIYERYEDQPIEVGQVIVFLDNENRIVHRVVEIEVKHGETRYYTQGDANNAPDAGFRTESDIFAVTNLKIPYLGHPTLWLRELISKS